MYIPTKYLLKYIIKLQTRYTRTDTCIRWRMSVRYIAVKFLSVSLNRRSAVSEVKPSSGSRSGLKKFR